MRAPIAAFRCHSGRREQDIPSWLEQWEDAEAGPGLTRFFRRSLKLTKAGRNPTRRSPHLPLRRDDLDRESRLRLTTTLRIRNPRAGTIDPRPFGWAECRFRARTEPQSKITLR